MTHTDVDKLMNETAFEEAVTVRGVKLVLAHPLSVHSTGRRGGFVGRLIGAAGRWLGRLIGADVEKATRRELAGCFCPEDRAAARRVISQLTAFEVVVLYRVVNEKAAAWAEVVVESSYRPSPIAHRGVGEHRLEDKSVAREMGAGGAPMSPRTATSVARGGAPESVTLTRGGGRLPAFMGGMTWGKARSDEVLAKGQAVSLGQEEHRLEAGATTEVNHGG